jgi:purine-nucleoside phosphorylase
MENLFEKINETTEFLKNKTKVRPKIAIILGTGLGDLVNNCEIIDSISYNEIPNFVVSTVESHVGRLIFGKISEKEVVIMQGRFHIYEGYTPYEITFPVRVFKALGVENLLISNAAGGLNGSFNKGDLMVITDHINFMGVNPLIGKNDDRLGVRFPDMCETYKKDLIKKALEIGKEKKLPMQKGVYVAVTGPNLETSAEYRMFRRIGADAVGMSTIPEAIVGVHSNLNVFAISIITDLCQTDEIVPVELSEIVETANRASKDLTTLMVEFVKSI